MRSLSLPWVLVLTACGSAAPVPQSTAPEHRGERTAVRRTIEPSPSAGLLRDGGWGRVSLSGLALSLELPDARGWRPDGGRDWIRWFHAASNTLLEVRRLRASPTVRPAECAADAGLGAGDRDESASIEQRTFTTDEGLRFELRVGLEKPGESGKLVGSVEAAAAGHRACVALRVRTSAQGAGAERELAARLGSFSERVVPSLALQRVEDRVRGPADPEFP